VYLAAESFLQLDVVFVLMLGLVLVGVIVLILVVEIIVVVVWIVVVIEGTEFDVEIIIGVAVDEKFGISVVVTGIVGNVSVVDITFSSSTTHEIPLIIKFI